MVSASRGRPSVRFGTRLWFLWFGLVAAVVTIPASIVQVTTNAFSPTARNFKRWATIWGRLILGATGVRVELEHATPLDPDEPYVFIANHQNTLDILSLAGWLPYPFGYVAKAELSKVPLLGFALRHSASVLIDRSDPRKSLESLKEGAARIRAGNSVLIYPEGQRTYEPQLHPFKKGAFLLAAEAGVPIVPVTVRNAYQCMDERRYVGRPGTIRITLGTPIPTAELRRRDIPALIDTVRKQMEAALSDYAPTTPVEPPGSPLVERATHDGTDRSERAGSPPTALPSDTSPPDSSMALSTDEVRYIARLARLRFSPDEQEQLAQDMGKVLDYMDTLDELDTSGVPPMSHVLDLYNVHRDDKVASRIDHDDALRNAPDADGDYFRVPKVID
ncbi:MAG: Asp-tRNA(Asn)/Glu-tRNA(Gln) amidotransferase subunit GatC [Bacteroidetes bacterium]|jgi:1-acyl-sn-glycerol-3-phosphate acyltransferase|nr:Asp-tRNA(Asn)/Glu-tRNA(Gln) amidotransferase subunit GatC [Bacteroidota bacterium]